MLKRLDHCAWNGRHDNIGQYRSQLIQYRGDSTGEDNTLADEKSCYIVTT